MFYRETKSYSLLAELESFSCEQSIKNMDCNRSQIGNSLSSDIFILQLEGLPQYCCQVCVFLKGAHMHKNTLIRLMGCEVVGED